MKKIVYVGIIGLLLVFTSIVEGYSDFSSNSIEQIKLTGKDIPEGFTYGKIPRFYTHVLKGNPWMMDRKAIQKLAGKIYPGGDYNSIAGMHMSIIANKNTPYGDDIVCYVILYKNKSYAKKEIEKINNFASYNQDRAIVVTRDNMVVFLHVDDIKNYSHIQNMADEIKTKLEKL